MFNDLRTIELIHMQDIVPIEKPGWSPGLVKTDILVLGQTDPNGGIIEFASLTNINN